MTIDFFVHPEFHSDMSLAGFDSENYQLYIEQLIEAAKKSEFPVLIVGLDDRIFRQLIPQNNQFVSASFQENSETQYRGEIHPLEWQRFVNVLPTLDGQQVMIHGSYLAECLESFAVQLFAYLRLHEHWHDWIDDDRGRYSRERKSLVAHLLNGDFSISGIRYGHVLPPSPTEMLVRVKPGGITYQLVDSNTIVHHLGSAR